MDQDDNMDLWMNIATAGIAIAGLLVGFLISMVFELVVPAEPAEAPTETERLAQFEAQERYYEALALYGDAEGAEDAARVVWEGYDHD